MPTPPIATAIASGPDPSPELAATAVHEALARTGNQAARGVLLFLTSHFARNAQAAVVAASRASSCLQVYGCTAAGVVTDEDWLLDRPGAAALVMTGELVPRLPLPPEQRNGDRQPVLSLAGGAGLEPAWLNIPQGRYGAFLASRADPSIARAWSAGKMVNMAPVELTFRGATVRTGVSLGIRPLSRPIEITQAEGHELRTLGNDTAFSVLLRQLPPELLGGSEPDIHRIFAGVMHDRGGGPIHGRYSVVPVIAINREEESITLGTRLTAGDLMFWGLRSPLAAEQDMRVTVDRLVRQKAPRPDFGLFFSCLGRGPYLYGTADRDLAAVRAAWPRMPLIGVYTPGEIAPLVHGPRGVENAVVLALVSRATQPRED